MHSRKTLNYQMNYNPSDLQSTGYGVTAINNKFICVIFGRIHHFKKLFYTSNPVTPVSMDVSMDY